MVVGFIITYANSAYHHWCENLDRGEVYNIMWYGMNILCSSWLGCSTFVLTWEICVRLGMNTLHTFAAAVKKSCSLICPISPSFLYNIDILFNLLTMQQSFATRRYIKTINQTSRYPIILSGRSFKYILYLSIPDS